MNTILFTHSACLEHDPGPYHPERPARLKAIQQALEGEAFHLLDRREAPMATVEQIAQCHPRDYVERVLESMPAQGQVAFDPDTSVSPGSREAALRAAGALIAAVDAVFGETAGSNSGLNAFCAVRPPGHHAEATRPMGFCIFNNIAVGAAHARATYGIERVAVVDFDVHHGNGTQDIFWMEPGLFYASTHQSPLYPGTGYPEEKGTSNNIVNVPLRPMSGSPEFRAAMTHTVLPAVDAFAPELIMISAGFDGHSEDPLANLHLTEDDFAWATKKLVALAAKHCSGRLVSALEGGYDLRALSLSVSAHVRALMAD